MGLAPLTLVNMALFVAFIALMLYGRYWLGVVLALLVNAVGILYGIVYRQWWIAGLNVAGALWVLWNLWRTRRRREPIAKAIGDESRQLREKLVRKMRRRRAARRGLSPEPSQ
jgi:hypothetical protein